MTQQEIETQRDITAYELAKKVCEKTQSYWEAFYILEKASEQIERKMKSEKSKTFDFPVDRYGGEIEMPQNEAQGKR